MRHPTFDILSVVTVSNTDPEGDPDIPRALGAGWEPYAAVLLPTGALLHLFRRPTGVYVAIGKVTEREPDPKPISDTVNNDLDEARQLADAMPTTPTTTVIGLIHDLCDELTARRAVDNRYHSDDPDDEAAAAQIRVACCPPSSTGHRDVNIGALRDLAARLEHRPTLIDLMAVPGVLQDIAIGYEQRENALVRTRRDRNGG